MGLAFLEGRAGPLRNVETICGDAGIIELPVSSVDKVVCFDTLHDIPNSPQAVDRWSGLLRLGGVLLYRDPEIPPEKVATYSGGRLEQTGSVSGVHALVRR
jgi:SAM-dependent methyltransferase